MKVIIIYRTARRIARTDRNKYLEASIINLMILYDDAGQFESNHQHRGGTTDDNTRNRKSNINNIIYSQSTLERLSDTLWSDFSARHDLVT